MNIPKRQSLRYLKYLKDFYNRNKYRLSEKGKQQYLTQVKELEIRLKLKEKQYNNEYYKQKYKKYGKKYYYKQKCRRKYQNLVKKWYITNPKKKKRANMEISKAIRNNRIKKPENCKICGLHKDLVAHHMDYDKPLKVIWVCRRCHSKIHYGKLTDSEINVILS